MEDIDTLARSIMERKIQRAREASIEEKFLDGPRLFRLSCLAMQAGLRLEYPDATDAEIHERMIQRVYGR